MNKSISVLMIWFGCIFFQPGLLAQSDKLSLTEIDSTWQLDGKYTNGKKEGLWKVLNKHNQIIQQGYFKNDQRDGPG